MARSRVWVSPRQAQQELRGSAWRGRFSWAMLDAKALRSGVYIVPTHRWYIERTVWLIAGFVLLGSTALAALVHPLWVLAVIATGLASITVALTGFCIVGNVLRLFGFTPMLGAAAQTRWNLYFMQ